MISAVLILVVAVPMVGGRYVVLEIKGFICCVCQDGFCMMGVGASWRTPSVALAVMMGYGLSGCAGVKPPSTVIMIGVVEGDNWRHTSCSWRWTCVCGVGYGRIEWSSIKVSICAWMLWCVDP